jgi:ascorbate-specific PTS system EIIC-type component UlaA
MHNGSRHQSRRHWQQILLLVYDNKMSAPLLLIGMCAVIGLFSLQEDI